MLLRVTGVNIYLTLCPSVSPLWSYHQRIEQRVVKIPRGEKQGVRRAKIVAKMRDHGQILQGFPVVLTILEGMAVFPCGRVWTGRARRRSAPPPLL